MEYTFSKPEGNVSTLLSLKDPPHIKTAKIFTHQIIFVLDICSKYFNNTKYVDLQTVEAQNKRKDKLH